MNRKTLLGATALHTALFGAAFAFASTASAQTAVPATPPTQECSDGSVIAADAQCPLPDSNPAPEAASNDSSQSITVTGSRIRRPNLESTVPITSIAGEQIFQQAQNSVGDTLNDLPQLRSTFAQQNPGLGIGIAGLNLLDLRGLGTQRTLVLVNGRRHVSSDILNNAVSVDVNTIPSDLIERIDIVTGGNSAIYGSDAIAGVVNFVLRRSYNGFQIRGQAAVTEEGFGASQYVSALAGRNFLDGRANITVHGEYSRSDRVFASNVPAFRRNDNFITVDADSGVNTGVFNGGDGVFDAAFVNDIRSSTIYFNGLVPINQRNIPNTGICGNATISNNGGPTTTGPAFNCTYLFTPEGRLVQQTALGRFGTGINPAIIGGNGQTGREGRTVSVLPSNERYNFNLLSRFEITPAAEVFVEGKWNRVIAQGNNAGPSFIQTGNVTDFRERTRIDNPFLNPADRTTLANLILASNCNTDLLVTCPERTNIGTTAAPIFIPGNLTDAQRAQIADGSYRFVVARNLLDAGLRDARFERDTYRVVGGLRGTFNEDWTYELSANYGKFKETTQNYGFLDRQRFGLSIDAGRNPVTGQIQCRSQFDPASAVRLQSTNGLSGDALAKVQAANSARLAADIAACVPYNPFGGQDNSAAIAYFSRDYVNKASLSQFILSGFVSGDTSQLFELPGGPISIAVGAEYRREEAYFNQDQFVADGFTNAVSIPTFKPDAFKVKEAFGEVRIPILRESPLSYELTLSGAGRVADYQGSAGTVYSYNAGVDWAPVRDIRFRANYSRAVRAPNVSETGFPLVPNFSNGFVDPCGAVAINNGSSTRAANCTAQIGASRLPNISTAAQSLAIVSGSNPNLDVETSDSYTVGVVVQPASLPGLSLSLDYYDIQVDGVIASVAPQTVVNQCYDSPTLNNIFCGQFQRNLTDANGPAGERPGVVLANSLISAPLNFANRIRRGIDVNVSLRRQIGRMGLDTSLVLTQNFENSNYQDPTNPNFETRVLGQLGDPETEFRWDVNLGFKPLTLGYRMRYIGKQYFAGYNSFFELNGQPRANVDAFPDIQFDPVVYHDLRADFDVGQGPKNLNFTIGVDNVLDKGVPKGAATATGAGSAIYSFRGRSFYAGARVRF
ncbi:TonB-dependent receptor domain-containing protein [Sphingomonas glaciei]|uniref:TonB-dependent receptor n=1 Tax=Sphingomonas glaciei TaxID=2938948 RepID=A0ABY5N1Q0_9SPHN|nr:TonB-dependent receptor [Sphingomonas glaciei]UUR08506.1 TonB-dependent receptor [Sphingomonas glaciei]